MSTAVAKNKSGVVTLGSIAAALPHPVSLNASSLSAAIVGFNEQSLLAEGNALRAEIKDEETLGRGADVIKGINAQITQLDETRLNATRPYDTAKSAVITLFSVAKTRLEAAKQTLSAKMREWQKAETARLEVKAAADRALAAKEAQDRADAQIALGDGAGAEQILEEAAAVPVVLVRVGTVGMYGGKVGTRKAKVGTVRNIDSFLNALSKRKEPAIKEFAATIDFPKSGLNRLAALILNGDMPAIPGFDAEEKSDLDVR